MFLSLPTRFTFDFLLLLFFLLVAVEVLTAEFEEKFNNQRIKYENKLMTMENQISDLKTKYEESQKGFFTKMIERCKKR